MSEFSKQYNKSIFSELSWQFNRHFRLGLLLGYVHLMAPIYFAGSLALSFSSYCVLYVPSFRTSKKSKI